MAEIDTNGILETFVYGQLTVGNIILFILFLAATFVLVRLVSGFLRRTLAGKTEAKTIDITVKSVRTIIYVIGIIVACTQLKIDLSGLLVAGGVVGVAVGFASQNTLSNLVAGILLMFERPVNVGDSIVVNGTEGYVEGIGLLSTRVRTYSGLYVRIPNDSLFTSEITNMVSNVARRFDYNISIRYSDDAKKAIKAVKRVINEHPYALKNPAPSVYVDNLGAHGIELKVRIWSPSGFWWDARTELLWTIFKVLRQEDIDVPFDQLTVWFGQEDAEKLSNSLESGSDMTVEEILGKSEKSPENANSGRV
ncbi:MAG: mechanosensitive ion channel family protein [Methanocorpusculum parvum]|nr:mechanosensitive ion channel family protein [Methanocorpusculum parvum]